MELETLHPPFMEKSILNFHFDHCNPTPRCLEPFYHSMATLKFGGFWESTGSISRDLVFRYNPLNQFLWNFPRNFDIMDDTINLVQKVHHRQYQRSWFA